MTQEDDEITVEIDCRIVNRTDKATLIDHGTPEHVWIPNSQVVRWIAKNDKITGVEIPEWLAIGKGLV